jgi:long-subunit fatty acid transport protein
MRARALALTAFAAISFSAPLARAGIEDTFGLGPNAMALGGSYAARPGDYAAAYYNPAGIAPGGSVHEHGGFFDFSAAFVYAHPSLRVTGANGGNLPTATVDDTAGLVLGSRFSVGQPFHLDGLDMALAIYVPGHLFQWSIRPDDDLQWGLLTDRTQVFSAHAGLAYRLTRWLSLGASLRVSFDAQTLVRGQVTNVALANDPQTGNTVVKTSTQLGTDAQVYGTVSPIFGATLTPIDRLKIGLVYRQKSSVDDYGNTRISGVPDLGDMGYTHRFAHYFEPTELTLATSVDIARNLDVSGDLTFNRWSEALSTNRNEFGSGIWGDTWTPAFGTRWRAADPLTLMAGYRYQRSPLDNFGGPSNLLDNDRHVGSLGFEFDLQKFFPDIDARVTTALSYTVLVERTETKNFQLFTSDAALTSNPGYPSYSYGGHIVAASLGVSGHW